VLLATAAGALALPTLGRTQPAAGGPGGVLAVRQDGAVAPGFRRDVLVRWGDRVTPDAPAWDPRDPTPEAASAQFGWDARVCGIAIPPAAADGVPRGVLAVAHPGVEARMAWPGGGDRPAEAGAMQGASLLNIEKRGGRWTVTDGGFQSRRLTAGTLCRVSGPAAGLAGGGGVIGLLGVRGGGVTPWGTLLLAEGDAAEWVARLGRTGAAAGYGWVAELDPFDPQAVPVKRTALGRFAHGDAAATLAGDGRAVVYLTDRRPAGFLYRFVSAGPATGPDALDQGTLSVARRDAGGGLRWVALPADAATVADPGEAARQAGGSAFDGPSGLALDPRQPRLLLACRGSPARPAGLVLEIAPAAGGDDAGEEASVTTLLEGGQGPSSPVHPDTVSVDARGQAWIGTDHGGQVRELAEGLFLCALDGPRRGTATPVYGAPRAASVGGAALPPDGEILFAAVRHPGAEPTASFERPATRWPQFEAGMPPRSTLIGLTREGGGALGAR
jgi:secreted PhoX family phosphatase